MKSLTAPNLACFAVLALAACTRDRPATATGDTALVDRDRNGVVDEDGVADRDRDGVVGRDRDGVVAGERDRDGVAAGERDRRERQRGNAELRPASRVTPAAESIAQARCSREQRCDNIGKDEKYSSIGECMTDIRDDWKDDLSARECPGGVHQDDLQECLTAIRNEDCGSPFDTLSRVAECTAAQICDDDAND